MQVENKFLKSLVVGLGIKYEKLNCSSSAKDRLDGFCSNFQLALDIKQHVSTDFYMISDVGCSKNIQWRSQLDYLLLTIYKKQYVSI